MAGTPSSSSPTVDPQTVTALLLPSVRRASFTAGTTRIDRDAAFECRVSDERIHRAAHRLQMRWPDRDPAYPSASIRIAHNPSAAAHEQGYRLSVAPAQVTIEGHDPAGCFYGLQTLSDLIEDGEGWIPCGVIEDWPALPTRGLLHDITRGKVPTLNTLKSLVDRLAALKINQLQLYIEHAFTFAFDPEICTADDGITPDEARALHDYAKERFIDLVPAVATFGHMGRILSLPQYRHLAEIAPEVSWQQLDWPRRARGFTLNCLDQDAWRLVERIWSEILDAFPGKTVNICGDEPWDLGKGKNSEVLLGAKRGEAYLDHITKTYEFCQSRGRRVQFWSDVIRTYPALLSRVPRDATVLHWGYDDAADYGGAALFKESGLPTIVCPGTSGWKRIVNSVALAERNITRFASVAIEVGADGLINTDWGDHGHFQPPACSWHGIARGAQEAWNPDSVSADDFDRRWSRRIWPATGSDLAESFRRATEFDDGCESWRLFWQPLHFAREDPHWPSRDNAERIIDAASRCRSALAATAAESRSDDVDRAELDVACRFLALFAERALLSDHNVNRRATTGKSDIRLRQWLESLNDAAATYADVWRRRNKPSGLSDIINALGSTRDDLVRLVSR